MLETRPRTENWTLSINPNQRNPQRGCYLALTFGTLLSSQGADAQRLDPLGLRLWRLVPLYAVFGVLHPGGALRGPPGPVRRVENDTRLSGPVRKSVRGVGRHTPPTSRHSPRKPSMPTVRPGCRPISRTARSTPGMKEARS